MLPEVRDLKEAPQVRQREAVKIAKALAPGAFVVALDERGRGFTSHEFAEFLNRSLEQGTRDMSFVIGGAAGTALTPLPWKITDDLSIGSQNWPWTPVPPKGETTYVTSTCTLCPGGCGISVRRVEDRVVKVEGLKGHPVNDGRVCILGASGTQLLYGPSRVQTPMKKFDGAWRSISGIRPSLKSPQP